MFHCADGSAVLEKGAVNDDYCDCMDGSDEPGTAACAAGSFYCLNRGFRPTKIPSYFVDDGVCDCCDGSDEGDGQCPNGCLKLGEKLREELKQRHDSYVKALKEKASRMQDTVGIVDEWKKELIQCQDDIRRQQEFCDALELNVTALEEEEKQRQAAEKEAAAANLAKLRETENAIEHNTSEEDPMEKTSEEKDPTKRPDDVEGEQTESDDVAEIEAGSEYYSEEDDSESEEETTEAKKLEAEYVNDDDRGKSQEEMVDAPSPSLFTRIKQIFTSFFTSSGSSETYVKTHPSKERLEETELQKLRKKRSDEKRELRNMENKRDDLQTKIERDYGPNSKFVSLADKCFEMKQDKYTYEICPFKSASQKEKHNSVKLGRFEGFSESYEWMEFDQGQRCGHGKNRSLMLYFVCGSEDAIQSVTEPDVCVYAANFSTPIVCSETELDELRKQVQRLETPEMDFKDEL